MGGADVGVRSQRATSYVDDRRTAQLKQNNGWRAGWPGMRYSLFLPSFVALSSWSLLLISSLSSSACLAIHHGRARALIHTLSACLLLSVSLLLSVALSAFARFFAFHHHQYHYEHSVLVPWSPLPSSLPSSSHTHGARARPSQPDRGGPSPMGRGPIRQTSPPRPRFRGALGGAAGWRSLTGDDADTWGPWDLPGPIFSSGPCRPPGLHCSSWLVCLRLAQCLATGHLSLLFLVSAPPCCCCCCCCCGPRHPSTRHLSTGTGALAQVRVRATP